MALMESRLAREEIPDCSLTRFVFEHVGRWPEKAALIDGPSGRSYTYAQIDGMVRRFAGGLRERGLSPGDTLAILSPNLPEYAVVFHGTLAAGGVVTTLNPTYRIGEVVHQLKDSSARWLFTISHFLPLAQAAAAQHDLEGIVLLGDAPIDNGEIPFGEMLSAEPFAGVDVDDPSETPAVLPYSSGTTGLSKGVILTHRNLVANLVQTQSAVPLQPDEVSVAVLPFFHIYGMQVLMNNTLRTGTTAVTLPRFDLGKFLEVIQNHQVNRAYLVPPIVLALAKHPMVDNYDLGSLSTIMSGAAPLDEGTAKAAASRLGSSIYQGYGLTESSPIITATPPQFSNPGSAGMLVCNTSARIVNPKTGEDVEEGGDGEIWIRGPQVMKGYLNNPEATATAITPDGWLRTGDIGHADSDEFFYVVDRLKELIKYKGFQIPPAELEGVLLTHPDVADAAVIPVADDEAGEIPKALVVLKPDAGATAEELMSYAAGQVAPYKRIRELEFIEQVPKSLSGKILRRVLRDAEAARGRPPQGAETKR